ncbi:hypothetical protein QFC21_002544 [Naganishia friedmannii]|uniref:Uncharacterized protein n=1 Tax=Naganishia friedmannii TaxID=89922 RepID=A0ACC2VW57_9TREE|nr:hypothetical protein QFC21_002544 [Naganishia friedmannii]
MIRTWLNEIAPIDRAALESPIGLPIDALPPSPVTSSAEIVSITLFSPSPSTIGSPHAIRAEPGNSRPNAAVEETRSGENVLVLRRLVPGTNDHPNAIYMKTMFMNFIEGVMKKEYPPELLPEKPDCSPEHFNRLRLLVDLNAEKDQNPLEQEIEHGCFFVRTPGLWIVSFADRWTVEDSHESPADNTSRLSFVVGGPDVVHVKQAECVNDKRIGGAKHPSRFRRHMLRRPHWPNGLHCSIQ